MPLFRFHRRSLQESIKNTIIVKNFNDIINIIYEDWKMRDGILRKDGKKFNREAFDIKIENYIFDDRIGWHTQIISADLEKKDNFICIGFLSEPL